MELSELVGKHMLDAVDYGITEKFKDWGDRIEDCEVVRFRLDGVVYTAAEDPDDGYRSCMRDLVIGGDVKNIFTPIEVVGKYVSKKTDSYGTECDILELVDASTGKVVLEIGTDNTDDYYPSFVACFSPENMVINSALSRPASTDNEWIAHDGKWCPVDDDLVVEIDCAGGEIFNMPAADVDWKIMDDACDVLRYRVVKP